ncbi:MAG: hypothetical protein RL885_30865 [Planctomycetota bacterium]
MSTLTRFRSPVSPPPRAQRGSVFVSVLLGLSGAAILAGTMFPLLLNPGQMSLETSLRTRAELNELAQSLERYNYEMANLGRRSGAAEEDAGDDGDNGNGWGRGGRIPSNLNDPSFRGRFHKSLMSDAVVQDMWSHTDVEADAYRVHVDEDADVMTLYSVGPNGIDEEGEGDDISVRVSLHRTARRLTRERLQDIHFALKNLPPIQILKDNLLDPENLTVADFNFLPTLLSGSWFEDRAMLGLGEEYDYDAWGTPFISLASSLIVFSAGPDLLPFTADDISF